jgi:tRNA-dependent cyclodipeptide synthase
MTPKLHQMLPARVQISLANRRCSGKELGRLFEWLAAENITRVEVQLSDSLHRHNLLWSECTDLDSAHAAALKLGDAWLHENRQILGCAEAFFNNFRVTRWDRWINDSNFGTCLKKIESIYETDEIFQVLIENEIVDYFERRKRSLSSRRKELSVMYFIEEIAVTDLSNELELANEVYPGPRFEPEEYLSRTYQRRPDLVLGCVNFIHFA